jgi:hypothetical protein
MKNVPILLPQYANKERFDEKLSNIIYITNNFYDFYTFIIINFRDILFFLPIKFWRVLHKFCKSIHVFPFLMQHK